MGTGYRKRFAPVMVISLVGVIVAGAGIALASPLAPSTHYDPMVAVARDITAQSYCQLSWEKEQGHKQVTIKVATCPAGTLIHTTKVPLSEALAKKEQYVLLPPRGSSSQVMAHIYQQIRDLRAADEMPFVHRSAADSPQTIHPLCNSTQSSVHLSWSPNYDKGSKFNSTMYYYGCGSQVMLVNGTIQGSQLDEANYWDHDQDQVQSLL